MKRGQIYRVAHPNQEPNKFRDFAIVSRHALIDSRFSTIICAPIYASYDGLTSQVAVGAEEGLENEGSVHCDELVSLPKSLLTNYIGTLLPHKIEKLNVALQMALDLPD
jgi:mRNA interferase MazF